jgi:subtilisin family serine protease
VNRHHPFGYIATFPVRAALAVALSGGLLGVCAPGTVAAMPNDPYFSLQWGDSNRGQAIRAQDSEEVLGARVRGMPHADDRALAAWEVTTGSSSIVIGEADTGVEYGHPDLAANIWTNPGGVGGCASGTHGFNVVEPRGCDPLDEEPAIGGYGGHGTHVAGIMGAVGNNREGVAGMNWHASILPVKWLGSADGPNATEYLIRALEALVAAKQAGVNVRIVIDSPSFRGTAYSPALSHEIDVLGENGILLVTAAGNSGADIDEASNVRYPCAYQRPNEICVTATDNSDRRPGWADWGASTVDLAAPGVSVYSTLRGRRYGYLSGGSMAAAQVAGAAALILSARPTMSTAELKADILDNVDRLPSLAGRVRTGGRLDVARALPSASLLATTIVPVEHGRAMVKLRCVGAGACNGKLTLAVRVHLHRRGEPATKLQTIGGASFSLPRRRTTAVAVAVGARGRARLRAAHGRLDALLTILGSATGSHRDQRKTVHLRSVT